MLIYLLLKSGEPVGAAQIYILRNEGHVMSFWKLRQVSTIDRLSIYAFHTSWMVIFVRF